MDDALRKGARVAGAGRVPSCPSSSNLYPPIVLVDVDHSMSCMRDETFGPILPVMRFTTDDEAIALVNNSRYGLSATIFAEDVELAHRMAHRLDVGAVNINDVFANLFTLALPQGGRGESGVGTRNGSGAVYKYCRPQAVVTARFRPRRERPGIRMRRCVGRSCIGYRASLVRAMSSDSFAGDGAPPVSKPAGPGSACRMRVVDR